MFKEAQNIKIKEHIKQEKSYKRLELAVKKQAMLETNQKDTTKTVIPKFKIVLAEPSYLKDSINILKGLLSEARIVITKDKMEIIAMDPANVTIVVWRLLSSVGIEWKVNKQFSFGINLPNLDIILKNCKANDLIEITNNQLEPDKLSIWFRGNSIREYSIETIQLTEKEHKIPDLKFDASIKMPSSVIDGQIQEANNMAESVTFEVTKEGFSLKAESDINKLRIQNKEGENVTIKANKEFKTKYSIEYLLSFIKSKKLCDEVTLEFSKDYPLKMSYKLLDKLSFEWILAPRVESD